MTLCTMVTDELQRQLSERASNKDKIPEENELDDIYKALVLGAKDYIQKNNFPGVLIGSSGGIDSALTATIAVDAIGPKIVKTYMMPFKFLNLVRMRKS